jgi:hypothetical protein
LDPAALEQIESALLALQFRRTGEIADNKLDA